MTKLLFALVRINIMFDALTGQSDFLFHSLNHEMKSFSHFFKSKIVFDKIKHRRQFLISFPDSPKSVPSPKCPSCPDSTIQLLQEMLTAFAFFALFHRFHASFLNFFEKSSCYAPTVSLYYTPPMSCDLFFQQT